MMGVQFLRLTMDPTAGLRGVLGQQEIALPSAINGLHEIRPKKRHSAGYFDSFSALP